MRSDSESEYLTPPQSPILCEKHKHDPVPDQRARAHSQEHSQDTMQSTSGIAIIFLFTFLQTIKICHLFFSNTMMNNEPHTCLGIVTSILKGMGLMDTVRGRAAMVYNPLRGLSLNYAYPLSPFTPVHDNGL